MSLLRELKRRRVFQTAAMYLVAGWLVVQVVDVVKEPLQLAPWFHTVVIIVVAIGFPIALMLSWVFDLTRGGVVVEQYDDGDEKNDATNRQRQSVDGEFASSISNSKANWAIAAVIVVSLLFAGYLAMNFVPQDATIDNSSANGPVRRFTVELPRNLTNAWRFGRPVSISADGQRLIFHAEIDGQTQLYSRSLDSIDVSPIEGTQNTDFNSIVSPDGEWLAFVDRNNVLKKVPIAGGVPVELCDFRDNYGDKIAWSSNDMIVFSGFDYPGLMQVSSSGGIPEPITFPEADETHKNPAFLPDGNTLLYSIGERGTRPSQTDRIGVISLESGAQKVLGAGASPQAISNGLLIFYKSNALWAVAFDADRLEIISERIAITDGVSFREFAYYAVSNDGTLVYAPTSLEKRSLAWVDRMGNEEEIPMELQHYIGGRISPNGEQISATIKGPDGYDLWLHSLTRGTWDRLTFDESQEWSAVWDPDGQFIYFSAGRIDDLYRATTDGTAIVEQLTDTFTNEVANSITPDGRQLIYHTHSGDAKYDLAILTLNEELASEFLLQTEFNETHGRVSPDGQWLMYTSDRSGRSEVYVRPYPVTDSAPVRISSNGAFLPAWARSGKEIFFWGPTEMMVVEIETEPTFVPGLPRALFSLQDQFGRIRTPFIIPDSADERFLIQTSPPDRLFPHMRIMVVQNWLGEVVRKIEAN